MDTLILKAVRISDKVEVYIVGLPSNDRVWVSASLDDAQRNKGRSDFAERYSIDHSKNYHVYYRFVNA